MVHEVPRARRRDDKTEALLAAAMRAVVSDGLEALTLQRVARDVGLVTTAIYRYFPSKDALLSALQRRAVTTLHAHFSTALADLGARLGERRLAPAIGALAPLLRLTRLYLALPQSHPEEFRLVSLMLGDPRRLIGDREEAARTAPLLAALLGDVHALFAHAAEVGALSRTHDGGAWERTLILWGTAHGLAQVDKLRRLAEDAAGAAPVDPTALGDLAVGALLRGFGAEPAQLTRALRHLA